jgi:putative ABC transport system permease protein
MDLFRNYLLFAWRNLVRQRLYSFINLAGLACGLACALLIYLYVSHERSYDNFHSKADRMYRLTNQLSLDGQGENSSSCVLPAAEAIMNDYPHLVASVVRFFNYQDAEHTLRYNDQMFNEEGVFFTDSSVFEQFDFPLLRGDAATVLNKPGSLVITESLARKYFGEEDPVGKRMKLDGVIDLEVSGIMADLPENAHFQINALIPFFYQGGFYRNMLNNWVWNPCWTYLVLQEGVTADQFPAEMPAFVQKYYPEHLKNQIVHALQPLRAIHLYSKLDYEITANGDGDLLKILAAIGLFILFIAGINYTNLATSRAMNRAREIGLRKVMGANRSMLVQQFLIESALTGLLAALLAMLLACIALPYFNSLAGKSFSLAYLLNLQHMGLLLAGGLITGLLAGLYPAWYLSAFSPAQVLKTSLHSSGGHAWIRKALVTAQFIVAVVLVVMTFTVSNQLQYLISAKLGFDRENVVVIPVRAPMASAYLPFFEAVKQQDYVVSTTVMNDVFGKSHNTHEFNHEGMQQGDWKYFPCLYVDENFLPTFQLELLAGRNFDKNHVRDDSLAVLVNEEMVKALGYESPAQALGKRLYTPHGHERIVGVLKNFNYVALTKPIGPMVFDLPAPQQKIIWTRNLVVRLKAASLENSLAAMQQLWSQYASEYPFQFYFLDEKLDQQYRAQLVLSQLSKLFAGLAIFIAILGLFALSAYTVTHRSREMGIRKVLGASPGQISWLVMRDFLKLALLALLIALPASWLLANYWLSDFAFRTDLGIGSFVGASLLLLAVVMLTSLYHTQKISRIDPVDALRQE